MNEVSNHLRAPVVPSIANEADSLQNKTISFVGGGNLARALISGLRKIDFPGARIVVSNRGTEKLQALARDFGITPAATNSVAAEKGAILVLAVRPKDVQKVVEEIQQVVQKKAPFVISLAAGLRMKELDQWFGSKLGIVRTMPNTATLVGKGITALFANALTTPSQKLLTEDFFNAVGITCWVKGEKELDLMTPFVGSSIAYLYIFIEAMKESAKKAGIDPDMVDKLARQTVYGAAAIAVETDASLESLEGEVATPGGVTEPSLTVLRKGGLFESLDEAFTIVADRCEKLGDTLSRAPLE